MKTIDTNYFFCAIACCTALAGTASAQDELLPAPVGSFAFPGLGVVDETLLPLELSDESLAFPQTEVTDLGVTPAGTAADVETSRSSSRITENTWTIGVLR